MVNLIIDDFSVVKIMSDKRLIDGIFGYPDKYFWSLSKKPKDYLNLFAMYFKCSSKFNLVFNSIPKGF